MMLSEQVYTQARLMDPALADENQAMLEALCASATAGLKARLRENVSPEDCQTDFVTAAAMYAMAAMSGIGGLSQLTQVSAGDLVVRKGENTAAQSLRQQADTLMQMYVKEPFVFTGV